MAAAFVECVARGDLCCCCLQCVDSAPLERPPLRGVCVYRLRQLHTAPNCFCTGPTSITPRVCSCLVACRHTTHALRRHNTLTLALHPPSVGAVRPFQSRSLAAPRVLQAPKQHLQVCEAASLQFIKGVNESTVPDVSLRRARTGTSGQAMFTFENPSIFQASSELGDITGEGGGVARGQG